MYARRIVPNIWAHTGFESGILSRCLFVLLSDWICDNSQYTRLIEIETCLDFLDDFFCLLGDSTELHHKPLIMSYCVCNELNQWFPVALELEPRHVTSRHLGSPRLALHTDT